MSNRTEKKHVDLAPSCRQCGGTMKRGKVLVPTTLKGLPDFPGDADDVRGQTMSEGPARLQDGLKCMACGHTVVYAKDW